MNDKGKISKRLFIGVAVAAFLALGIYFYPEFSKSVSRIVNASVKDADSENIEIQAEKKKTIKLLFVGDMMFDRYIRQVTDSRGDDFVFQKVADLFKSSDLVVGNLEGPISDNISVSVNSAIGSSNNYVFTFDQKTAKTLKDQNVSLVNIGNNHISNFGSKGMESTRNYLNAAGVDFFGDPSDSSKRIAIKIVGGWKIAFLNYDQFNPNAERKTLEDLEFAKSKKVDFIVLYTHWGTEFVPMPGENIKNLAHKFLDSGADFIIGSHPHVVQSIENYKGKMIYYSLGNFIFDQYFSPETQEGMIVGVTIGPEKNSIIFEDRKVQLMKNGQTILR